MENSPTSGIRLTQSVQKGGCAAKVAAVELRQILARVQFPTAPPELSVHAGTFDDAAIYRLNDDLALVQTLDFFTPIVDTPRTFGQIAAANALSDVYAMGGQPTTALAIFAFPLATMPDTVAVDVLQGASDIIGQSGAALAGGHTIDDDTLKFGLSVTGFVHPSRVWSNAGARAGDVLILTKPLGTGTLTAALKRGEVAEDGIADAIQSMVTLNEVPRLLSQNLVSAVHAATDITGFGLAGHALNLARASDVRLAIETDKIPRFSRALEFLEKGFLTKAHRTNGDYVQSEARFRSDQPLPRLLALDPQTSGGLLLAVEAALADEIEAALVGRFPMTRQIGRVEPAGGERLQFL